MNSQEISGNEHQTKTPDRSRMYSSIVALDVGVLFGVAGLDKDKSNPLFFGLDCSGYR
jgi:hypothetical protein